MTTKVTIINHGPKTMEVTGSLLAKPITITPRGFTELYMHEPLQIAEVDEDDVTPNLAGGHGEEGP